MGVDIREQARRKGMTLSEFSRKAALKASGRPRRKNFEIRADRSCYARCPAWEYCQYKKESKERYGGKCAVYHASDAMQEVTRKLAEGEEGIADLMRRLYLRLSRSLKDSANPDAILKEMKGLDMMDKMLFGSKSRIDAKVDTGFDLDAIIERMEEKRRGDKEK